MKSPVVHAKHTRGGEFSNFGATKLRQEGRSTDGHRLLPAQMGTCFPSECPSDVQQRVTQAVGATGKSFGQGRKPFREDLTRKGRI